VPLVVVVSLPAEALAPKARATLLDACSEALPEAGSCATATDGSPSGPAGIVAARGWVRWLNEAHTSAFVHLAMGGETHERILRFTAADPEVERLRAIGFALGTLVTPSGPAAPTPAPSASAVPFTTSAPSAPPPSPPASAPPSTPTAPPVSSGSLDKTARPAEPTVFPLFLGLSTGVTSGAARKLFPGLEGRVAIRIRALEVTIAGGASVERSDGPTLDTSLVWATLGARLPLWSSPRGRTFVRAEGFTEQLHAEVYGPDRPLHDFRWVPGVQIAADAEVATAGPVFLTAAFGLGVRFVQPHFTVAGRQAPDLGLLRITTTVGVGTRF
jgi:hypothetical protein